MQTLDIVLTGDSLITRPFGDFHATGYDELTELLRAADAGFTNLETVVQAPGAPSARPFAGYPAVESGGTYTAAPPAVLDDLRSLGLTLLSTANNHAMDYSAGGLHATLRAVFAARPPRRRDRPRPRQRSRASLRRDARRACRPDCRLLHLPRCLPRG